MSQTFKYPITESTYYGVNDSDPPETLMKGKFVKADNVYLSDNKIKKVPGSTIVGAQISLYKVNGMAAFEKISSSNKYLVANVNTSALAQTLQTTFDNVVAPAYGGSAAAGEGQQAQAQSFVASQTSITSIQLKVAKLGTPTDNLILDLTSTLGGASLGTVTVPVSSFNTGDVITFTFSSAVTVVSGNTYYIQITRSGSRDTTNFAAIYVKYLTNPYADGQSWSEGNAVWGNLYVWNATTDWYFGINYTTASVAADLYAYGGSSWTAIGANNLTNNKTMYFESAADKIFGFNGVEEVDYDGSTVTRNRATLPLGYYPKWFHNYLFVAATDTYPNRLFWSDLGTPTTFTAANYVDVNPGDSDKCTGLGVLQDELFFFKQNTIWSITGWSGASFSATTIATQNTNARLLGYGCVAPESIVSTGNDIYFLSFLGQTPVIRSLKKTQLAQTLGGGVISNDISVMMGTITASGLGGVCGIYDGRYAMWSLPLSSSNFNNRIICLDTWEITTVNGKTIYPWTTMTGKNAGHFAISTISGKQAVYFSDAASVGSVYKIDTSVVTDNQLEIIMDVRTRDFVLDPSKKSKWKYVYITYETGTAASLDINARVDSPPAYTNQTSISLAGNSPGLGPTGNFTLGVSQLGGADISTTRVILKHITGHRLGLQFYEDSVNDAAIHYYSIYGKLKGLRNN